MTEPNAAASVARSRKRLHLYACPECGTTVDSEAGHHARQRTPCRACIRTRNGWSCRSCGSADPHHPSPCPKQASDSSQAGEPRD